MQSFTVIEEPERKQLSKGKLSVFGEEGGGRGASERLGGGGYVVGRARGTAGCSLLNYPLYRSRLMRNVSMTVIGWMSAAWRLHVLFTVRYIFFTDFVVHAHARAHKHTHRH